MPANSKRAERQQKQGIQVIVGNPPWSRGQKSVSDEKIAGCTPAPWPAAWRRDAHTIAN